MLNNLQKSRTAWLGLGVVLGMAMAGIWPQSRAHAVATDRFEGYAICTGLVDGDIEAVYMLDSLTGQLQAAVMSTQQAQFTNFYTRDIMTDLALPANSNPRFLMVTGIGRMVGRGGSGLNRSSLSLLYVAEVTTGKIAVYTLPWTGNTNAAPVASSLIPIQVIPFRDQNLVRPGGAPVNGAEDKPRVRN